MLKAKYIVKILAISAKGNYFFLKFDSHDILILFNLFLLNWLLQIFGLILYLWYNCDESKMN